MRKRPLNTRQKRFIENHILKGMSIAESVRRAGYLISSGRSEDYSSVGCRILKTDRVADAVSRLREKQFEKDSLSFNEKRSIISRMVKAAPSDVGADSMLAQSYTEEVDAKGNFRRKVVLPDKARLIDLDNKMAGHNHADRQPQANNPFLFIVSLSKTEGQADALGDLQHDASVSRSPALRDAPMIEAEIVSDTSTASATDSL